MEQREKLSTAELASAVETLAAEGYAGIECDLQEDDTWRVRAWRVAVRDDDEAE
jgi:hypothetical protein